MVNSIKDTLKDLLKFLKAPTEKQDLVQSKPHKAKRLFFLLLIDIPLMSLLTILVGAFSKWGWVNVENHKMAMLLELLPIWMVLALSIIIIPFIEEIIFRLFLKFKRNYLLQVIIFILNGKGNNIKNGIINFWNKKYSWIFYSPAILFAFIHITNYDLTSASIYLLPILVLPQFILALFIGYLRVRYNFMLGYLMHVLHNAFFITIALVTITPSIPKLNTENNEYSLKIEEVAMVKDVSINYTEDSIQFVGVDMKNTIATLTNKDEYLVDGSSTLLNKKITLSYKKKLDINLNKDSIILYHLGKTYNFRLEPKYKLQKVYSLYVSDTLLLSKHYSRNYNEDSSITSTTTTVSSKSITLEYITLEQIARDLSSSYGVRFECQYPFAQKLNVKVPNGNLTELKSTLNKKYGINFKEVNKKVEYLYIVE